MAKNTRTRTRTRGRMAIALAAASVAAVTMGTTAASGATPKAAQAQAQETKQIASSQLGQDYKITLTALHSTTDQYAASVRLQVFVPSGSTWKESDRVTVGDVDGWYWYPLGGKGAVCEFSTASTEPAPVAVSLLITPSIGCSDAVHYEIRNGRVFAA
ncbi:MAG: hypothetical protein QOF44_1846 [Streptomyces sp.]|nr:hypothetical protein [Streptomyces sp.]